MGKTKFYKIFLFGTNVILFRMWENNLTSYSSVKSTVFYNKIYPEIPRDFQLAKYMQ